MSKKFRYKFKYKFIQNIILQPAFKTSVIVKIKNTTN